MPLYAGMSWPQFELLEGVLSVPMWFGTAHARVRLGRLPGSDVPIYFLEHHRYFDRPHLYGPPPEAYPDNLERFAFLSRGALELVKALGCIPDVIHANDWQTALVPVYVNTVEWAQPLHGSATLYTIHNLAYQGVYRWRGACSSPASDRSTTTPPSSSTSARPTSRRPPFATARCSRR